MVVGAVVVLATVVDAASVLLTSVLVVLLLSAVLAVSVALASVLVTLIVQYASAH